MKKHLYILFFACLLFTGGITAQDLLYQSYDDVSGLDNWQASGGGTYILTQSTDAAEGTGSMDIDYTVVGDQGWGGIVGTAATPSGTYFEDASAMEGLIFHYKTLTPATITGGDAWYQLEIFCNTSGGEALFTANYADALVDASGEWQVGKVAFSSFGWADWYGGANELNVDQISKIQLQIFATEGATATGQFLTDGLGAYSAGSTSIGTLLESFDVAGDTEGVINSDGGSYLINPSTDGTEGAGSTCLLYNLVADQSWGGSVDLTMTPTLPDTIYPDLTGEDGLRFDYKNITPASESAGVNWNVKVLVNSTGGVEEWHGVIGGVIDDASGEWQEAKINFSALAIPNWLTTYDGVFYPDRISGVVMQIVTNSVGLQTSGEICLDNLTSFKSDAVFYDGHYLNDFEAPFSGGFGNWQNSNAGTYAVSGTTETAEGDSAACVSYGIVGDQGWGGSVDCSFTPTNGAPLFQDLTEHEGLTVWFKVPNPIDVPANGQFVVKIIDGAAGEQFHKTIGGVLNDPDNEWKQIYMPFDDFATPNWMPMVNGVLDRDSIVEVQFQLLVPEGATANGEICFDNLRSYDDEEVTEFLDPTLSSIVNLEAENLKIYPNPVSSELKVDGLDNLERVEIFSVSGAMVKTISNTGNSIIDVHDLQNGFYFMKIYSEDNIYSTRFLKH